MKGRLRALTLCVVMALASFLLPAYAFAAQPEGTVHKVGTAAEFTQAVAEIRTSAEPSATIELMGDIDLADAFAGVEGKHIVVRGDTSTPPHHFLKLNSDIVSLTGDVTFENVYISSKTIYANGHRLTLGEGFGGGEDGKKRMIVYGGSNGDLTADTHVTVLDGVYKLIAGGNSAGTLTGNTLVEFGGNARFPNASDGKDPDTAYVDGTIPSEGSFDGGDFSGREIDEQHNLYFDSITVSESTPVMVTVYKQGYLPYGIYGGGIGGNVTGDTSVTMTGGKVFQIFGGGAAIKAPSLIGNDLGTVGGGTSVSVTNGEVKSVYGGGFNDIQSLIDDSNATGKDVVATDADRDTRATVAGSTNVMIGGKTHVPEATLPQWSTGGSYDLPGVYGGSFHSSVQNTRVTVGGEALIETHIENDGSYGVVWGGGCSDKVRGTTYVELTENARIGNDNNADIKEFDGPKGGTVTPLGRSADTRSYFGGVKFGYGAEILNGENETYAATAIVSGGRADVLTASHKRIPVVKNTTTVHGSVQLVQTGGLLQSIEAGGRNDKKVNIESKANRSQVDVVVSGGSVSRYIMGRYLDGSNTEPNHKSSNIDHAELVFKPCGNETAYLEVPDLIYFDKITVENGAHIAAKPEFASGPVSKTPFTEVGDLTIEKDGYLALRDDASITGALVLDGSLHLVKLTKKLPFVGEIALDAATLTAAGTAAGAGDLRTIALPAIGTDYTQAKTPRVSEECVYATAAGSDMALDLTNPEPTLFVDRKNSKTAGQDVWFINEQVAQDVTVTFDKNGGDTEAVPGSMAVTRGSTVGTLPAEPTRANYTFLGWNTEADGSGKAFDENTPVIGDITVYAQWKAIPEQPWYREFYYQFYEPDGSQTDENGAKYNWIKEDYSEGGWSLPGATVSIDRETFDGTKLGWDAIDGSGKETLGVHYVFDEGYGPHRLSALCSEATKDNPLKIYYRATPHTLTYEYEGAVPGGAPQPPAPVNSAYSAPVEIAAAPSMEGWEFDGWKVKSPENATIENGTLTMPNADVVLVGSWTKTATPIEPATAVYKVEHYKQQLDGTYQLADTDFPLYGKIGEKVTATPKGYDGYHINAEQSELTGTVFMPYEQDGKPVYLVLKAYYDLDQVKLHYDLNGGAGAEGVDYSDKTLPMGTEVTAADAPTLEGHDFLGWKKEVAGQSTKEADLVKPGDTFNLTADTTLTAQWEKKAPVVPPVNPDPKPEPNPDPEPGPQPEPEPEPSPDPKPEPEPDPQPEPSPEPGPEPAPQPEPEPEPAPEDGSDNGQPIAPGQPENPGTNSSANGQPQANAAIPAMNDFSAIVAAATIGTAALAALACIAAYRKVRKTR